MVEFLVLLVGIIIFLSICYFLRVKGIELPGSDMIDNAALLSLLLATCLIWPVSLPIAVVTFAGLFIASKFDD